MKLLLHIGTEKTGSTSVQKFLGGNRAALLTDGVLYSAAAGGNNHTKLVAYALEDEKIDTIRMMHGIHTADDLARFRSRFVDDLLAEVEAQAIHTLVFSNEHCSTRLLSVEDVERLHALMTRLSGDIRVIVYLRRQDQYLISLYSTAVKSGAIGKLILPGPKLVSERYDYAALLERWAAVFGRAALDVRIYSRERLVDGDSISDFLAAAGIANRDDFVRPARHLSNSLDVVTLEYLRCLNRYLPLFEGDGLSPHRGNIDGIMEKISDPGPQLTLPDEELDRFMAQFAESNAWVADTFFGRRQPEGDPLFGPRSEQHGKMVEVAIDLDDVFRITANLWKEKQAECVQLQRQIRELRQRIAAEKKRRVVAAAADGD